MCVSVRPYANIEAIEIDMDSLESIGHVLCGAINLIDSANLNGRTRTYANNGLRMLATVDSANTEGCLLAVDWIRLVTNWLLNIYGRFLSENNCFYSVESGTIRIVFYKNLITIHVFV